LGAVDIETVFHCLFLVVFPLYQRLTCDIVYALHFGWVELDVVSAPRSWVGAAPTHTLDDGVKGNINLNHIVQRHTSGFHGIRLWNGAWESVKEKTLGAVGLLEPFFDQVNDQAVADQAARVHDGFGLQAEFCPCFDCGAQHVAG
jgi:hypothetical protein